MKTAEDVLRSFIPEDCIWDETHNGPDEWKLTNCPVEYVKKAMIEYANVHNENTYSIEDVLKYAFWGVQYASKLEKDGQRIIKKQQIDDYLRAEILA